MSDLIIFFKDRFNLNPNNINLYIAAFTHSSFKNKQPIGDYESYEFLGDSIVGFAISTFLFSKNYSVPIMSSLKARIVSKPTLSYISKHLEFDKYIRIDSGCKLTESILEDVYESFIGVIYLDLGIDEAIRIVKMTLWDSFIDQTLPLPEDYKSKLQFLVQREIKEEIAYESFKIDAKDNEPRLFSASVKIGGEVLGTGVGISIKRSEQEAAKQAFETLLKRISI